MKSTAKGILVALPLVVGLAGSAAAAMADTTAADGAGGSGVAPGVIDSLLNQYSGLTPGDPGNQNPVTQTISPSQQLSTFTGSAGAMAAYFTTLGVDRTSPNQPLVPDGVIGSSSGSGSSSTAGDSGSDSGSGAAAAAPAVAALTVAHVAPDSLVSAAASAGALTPSGGGTPTPNNVVSETPQTPTPETPPTPVPLPAALVLLGSGLAALVPLRKRTRKARTYVT